MKKRPTTVQERKDETYQDVYERFWKDIIETNGVFDIEQVKKELSDYEFLLEQVPIVYCEVTGNRISKPNTYAFEVIGEYQRVLESREKDIALDDIEMMAKETGTVEQIRDYLSYE